MWKDPIVEEIRKVRTEYSASLQNDLERILEDIKARQAMSGKKLVTLPPKKRSSDSKSA